MSENKCEYGNIKDYKSAFECFKQRFLVERKSIFRLDDNGDVLTERSVEYLIKNFVNNGYSGDASFIDKIKHQLVETPQDKTHQKNAIEVLAAAVWLWRLPPVNMQDRKSGAEEVLKLFDPAISINKDNPFFKQIDGFASTGTYYNTNKPTELAYIIKFFQKYLEDDSVSPLDILNTDDFKGKMEIKTTKDYSYQDKKGKKNLLISSKLNTSHGKPRTVSIHNALLHLFDPDNYEPILSNDHKEKIQKAFSKIFEIDEEDADNAIKKIKNKLGEKTIFGINPPSFYDDKIKNIWMGGLDFESKNMILHGAPGTGKTYMTEETIKARKNIEGNSEYELVQFHPSYGYEDFIEGIKPIGLENGQMKFELKNGVFKQMCINAFKNLIESQNGKTKLKTFYFIADEINRAELSRVFGELLLCLEDDKRLRVVEETIDNKKVLNVKGTKVKLPNSSLWTKEHVVVCADENDKIVDDSDNKQHWYFGVPENIYFIGTMNDIDRSVDSFDMALRRRFTWKHYRCDYVAIYENYKKDKNDADAIEEYVEVCEKLNEHITKGFKLNDSYELGQSYFMKPKKLIQKELDKVWQENIASLLKEYLRAEYSQDEIAVKLSEAKDIFKLKTSNK